MGRLDTFRGEDQSSRKTPDKPKSRPVPGESTPVTATPLDTGGRGVQQGDRETRPAADVAHGAIHANKQSEGPPEPERIPSSLPEPTKKLADRVMSPGAIWANEKFNIREAMKILAMLEGRESLAMPTTVVTAEGEDAIPIWDYVEQCVNDVMSRGPDVWGPWLARLSQTPGLEPVVSRILALYTLDVYLSDELIKYNVGSSNMNQPDLRVDWFKTNHTQTYNALKAVGDFIKAHPKHGSLVKAIFQWQTPAFNTTFRPLLRECGLV